MNDLLFESRFTFLILNQSLSGKVVWFSSGNVVKIESTSPDTTTFRHFRRFTPCPGELMPWKTRSPRDTRYLEESTSSGQTSGIGSTISGFSRVFSPPLFIYTWLSISLEVFSSIFSNRFTINPIPTFSFLQTKQFAVILLTTKESSETKNQFASRKGRNKKGRFSIDPVVLI